MSSGTPPTPSNGGPAVPLVPTNTVTTASGLTVRTRIDPVLTVDDVVRQLCVNLKLKDQPSNFALRDETDELVTNDNLRRKIRAKVNLKLVNAPSREAMETAEKLRLRDDTNALKMTLFTLQKYIRASRLLEPEEQFAQSFINCSGLSDLIDVIFGAHGNTLAYALTAMQNLMELDYGWSSLDDAFIFQVVQILSSPQSLINVCRPATAILKKLVEADPMTAPGLQIAGSSRGTSVLPPGSVYRYGFSVVFEQMRKGRGFLETVISRLGSADTAMAQYSMMLINSLLSHASDTRWEEFIAELERLNVRKAVVRLMSSHTIEDLTSCILDFQANFIRVIHRKKTTPVDLEAEPSHVVALKGIWTSSQLSEQTDENGQLLKWRLLGLGSENIEEEFSDVGMLGLECLRKFIEGDPDFPKIIQEQLSRPLARRCPVARASNEVVEILSEHWAIFAPGYSTSTTFQPFFLDFYRVHSLATHFFVRMWSESGASTDDFARVAALVRSQTKVSLRMENVRPWHEVEHDFNACEYRTVRERQMKELEVEDDLLSKIPIRNLRAKLYKESYEFVRQQRIQCLMQGAWFINALPANSTSANPRRPTRPWRFLRLDPGMKYLHYVDSSIKFAIRSGLEDLPERIEVASISEIATGSCAAPPHVLRESDLPPTFPPVASPLSFSLLSAHEGSIADQIAPDQSRWADWTDGLNMLRRDGGHVSSKETAGFVQALTEIGLKIKLLDLSGEMVEIPSGLVAGPPPSNTDFFFSDLV
ncbi:ELMO domain-containing protein [Mycena indigotica]|uniref:ELMO domain-containing protein n=1 Tax=Mycena indigotica TaxID=2126181 RepID=A0A8H6T3U6_9AGAR|nr:ELMO domain-containing protein [Mycena indigotica]KAF7309761.1 ELMO domain-containing protein [Mycena indigotica]